MSSIRRSVGGSLLNRADPPGIESLERRDCPTVLFQFEGGVLGIVGDDGPNAVEISQARDGLVVSGDGEVRTFAGVNKVVVEMGAGNDDIAIALVPPDAARRSSLPSTLTPGVEFDVRAGSGDDLIHIGDGEASKRLHVEQARLTTLVVELGTGSDTLRTPLSNHRDVSLDVLSADGGDHIEAPISISLCNPPGGNLQIKCALRASLQLGGGGNAVTMQTRGFDTLDLNVVAAADPEPGDPSGNTIYISAGGGGAWLPAVQKIRDHMLCETDGTNCRTADISIDLRGGGGDLVDVVVDNYPGVKFSFVAEARPTPSIGVPPSSLSFTDTAGGTGAGTCHTYCITFAGTLGSDPPGGIDSIWMDLSWPPRRLDARFDLGAGSDRAALATHGVEDLDVAFHTGAGDDTVAVTAESANSSRTASRSDIVVDLGDGNDAANIRMQGFVNDRLSLTAGPGNDTAQADTFYGRGILKSTDGGQTWTLDLGEGDDQWTSRTDGYANVEFSIAGGEGDDTVTTSNRLSPFYHFSSRRLDHRVDLGAGADRLSIDVDGFGDVLNLIDAGSGDDVIESRHVRHRPFVLLDRTKLIAMVLLGPGSDSLTLVSSDARQIQTAIVTGPEGDGHDVIAAAHDSLSRSNRSPIDAANIALDGGLDLYTHEARGYAAREIDRTVIGTEWVFVA